MPPGEKRSGDQKWQQPMRLRDYVAPPLQQLISSRASVPFLSGFGIKCFEHW